MKAYGRKLGKEFYARDTLEVARELIGKYAVHIVEGRETVLEIIETEAYGGIEDKGCHGYGGRRTKRNIVMYRNGGYAYVYALYGNWTLNAVTGREGEPTAVFIRSCRPVDGLDDMAKRRFGTEYSKLSRTSIRTLTDGPGKLGAALGLTGAHNGVDLTQNRLFIAEPVIPVSYSIGTGKRINLSKSAEEAADYPYRFFIEKT